MAAGILKKVIAKNGDLFKQDLDATIANVKQELDEHVTEASR